MRFATGSARTNSPGDVADVRRQHLDSYHHLYRADSATRIGTPEDDFEFSRVDWVPLDTIPGLNAAGMISSATTLAALLYTMVQDGPGSR